MSSYNFLREHLSYSIIFIFRVNLGFVFRSVKIGEVLNHISSTQKCVMRKFPTGSEMNYLHQILEFIIWIWLLRNDGALMHLWWHIIAVKINVNEGRVVSGFISTINHGLYLWLMFSYVIEISEAWWIIFRDLHWILIVSAFFSINLVVTRRRRVCGQCGLPEIGKKNPAQPEPFMTYDDVRVSCDFLEGVIDFPE